LVQAVIDAVEALVVADAAAAPDEDLVDDLIGLAGVSGLVDVALARRLSVFGARGLHAREGATNAHAWLEVRSELASDRLYRLHRSGSDLVACPHVLGAYESGTLGSAKVEMLLRARAGFVELFAEDEADLVAAIAPLSVAQAKTAIGSWRRHAEALRDSQSDDGVDPATDESRNTLHASKTFGGRFKIDADVDAVTGQRFVDELEARRAARFADGTFHADDGLVRSQRDAVAFGEILAAGALGGEHRGGPRPSVHVSCDAKDLLGSAAEEVADIVNRRCHLDDGTVLGRSVAERLLCDADVTEVLTYFGIDGTRLPLGVVHHRRRPTRRERDALRERDRGCVFPGCTAPVGRTDAHHTVPYEIGRRTKLDELVLLCRFHHHQVHEGGFRLARTQGHVHVTAPDGTPLTVVPPGHKVPPPTPPPRRQPPQPGTDDLAA